MNSEIFNMVDEEFMAGYISLVNAVKEYSKVYDEELLENLADAFTDIADKLCGEEKPIDRIVNACLRTNMIYKGDKAADFAKDAEAAVAEIQAERDELDKEIADCKNRMRNNREKLRKCFENNENIENNENVEN